MYTTRYTTEVAAPTMVSVLHHSWPINMPTPEARKHSPAIPKSTANSREMMEDSRPRKVRSQELPKGVGHQLSQEEFSSGEPPPHDIATVIRPWIRRSMPMSILTLSILPLLAP